MSILHSHHHNTHTEYAPFLTRYTIYFSFRTRLAILGDCNLQHRYCNLPCNLRIYVNLNELLTIDLKNILLKYLLYRLVSISVLYQHGRLLRRSLLQYQVLGNFSSDLSRIWCARSQNQLYALRSILLYY